MKTYLSRLILLLPAILIVTLMSCREDDDNARDTTPPVITMLGGSPVYVEKGTAYTDAGATAMDETDGDITASMIVKNLVDPNVEGSYHVTYNVTDKAGNKAAEVSRTVVVTIF